MAPSLESQVNAMMAIMKRYSWKKFAVVTSTIPGHKEFVSLCRKYASDITNKPFKSASDALKFSFLILHNFSFSFEVVSTVVVSDARSETSVRDALKTVDSDVRIFFLYATQKDAALILAEAKWLGIADKNYLWIGTQSVVGVKMATVSRCTLLDFPIFVEIYFFCFEGIRQLSCWHVGYLLPSGRDSWGKPNVLQPLDDPDQKCFDRKSSIDNLVIWIGICFLIISDIDNCSWQYD